MILRKLLISAIASIFAVFFCFLFPFIASLSNGNVLNIGDLDWEFLQSLVFAAVPSAIFVAIAVEGFYSTSWKRNLLVNIVTFSVALVLAGLGIGMISFGFNSWGSASEAFANIGVIAGVGWVFMGIPFCLVMTVFGGYWCRFSTKNFP